MLRALISVFLVGMMTTGVVRAQSLEDRFPGIDAKSLAHYPEQDGSLSFRYTVGSSADSNTTRVLYNRLSNLCGDSNGCQFRVGVYGQPKPKYLKWLGDGLMSLSHDDEAHRWVATFGKKTVHGISGDKNPDNPMEIGPCSLVDYEMISNVKNDNHRDFGFYMHDQSTSGYCFISFID